MAIKHSLLGSRLMDDDKHSIQIPFKKGDWVIDKNKPGQPGQYTGNWRKVGPHAMIQLFLVVVGIVISHTKLE